MTKHFEDQRAKNIQAYKYYKTDETQAKIYAMDDFLFWMEYDCPKEFTDKETKIIKDAIKAYLDIDMDIIKLGELTLLENWKVASVKDVA